MNKLLIDRVVYCLRKWKFFVDHFKPRPAKKQTPNHKDKAGKVTHHKAKSVQHKQASSQDESKLFMETEMHNVLIHQQKFPFFHQASFFLVFTTKVTCKILLPANCFVLRLNENS